MPFIYPSFMSCSTGQNPLNQDVCSHVIEHTQHALTYLALLRNIPIPLHDTSFLREAGCFRAIFLRKSSLSRRGR
jgi:hypothetical protein